MDAFLDPRRRNLKAAIRKLMEDGRPGSGGFDGSGKSIPATAGQEWMDAVSKLLPRKGGGPWASVLDNYLIVEEISLFWPRLGAAIVPLISGKTGMDASEKAAFAAAELLATSTFLLGACIDAARRQNLFQSILMDFQKAQQELADLRAAVEAARFEAYRSILLLEEGRTGQGLEELVRTSAKARVLFRKILGAASHFLGYRWITERIPYAGRDTKRPCVPGAGSLQIVPASDSEERSG